MKKLGIDLGNNSIKAAIVVDGEVKKALVKSLATTDSDDLNNVITYKGINVHFGVGAPLIENDKTQRRYLEESIMLMTHALYGPGEHEIELGCSLPINLYKLAKDDYKEKLEAIKELSGKVNGCDILIRLKRVEIYAEGLSAFYALQPEIKKENILFIDIGFRTTDILSIGVVNGKWKMEGSKTIGKGAHDLIEQLKGPAYTAKKIFFTTEQLDEYIVNDQLIGEYDLKSDFIAFKPIVTSVMKEIEQYFNDVRVRKLYFLGGGSKLFTSQLPGEGFDYTLLENDQKLIYSNAVGNYLKL